MEQKIFIVASEWGATKGGINVFNHFLVTALSRVLSTEAKIYAVVSETFILPISPPENLNFLLYNSKSKNLAEVLQESIKSDDSATELPPIIIGHDVITGPDVLATVDYLKSQNQECISGLICHMDYNAYQGYKGRSLQMVNERAKLQRDLVFRADYVFAVGPLLKDSFQKIRTRSGAIPVKELIPGFPELLREKNTFNPSNALKFFVSGRITKEDDAIKNGRLALRALEHVFNAKYGTNEPLWKNKGTLVVYGFQSDENGSDWFFDGVDKNKLPQKLNVNLQPYSDQRSIFNQLLDSHVALMPSVHEGFGLTGWEALCAGVPLVCSDQSGLSQFLDDLFSKNHDLPSESIIKVSLGTVNEDVSNMSEKIAELIKSYDRRKKHAETLADHLKKYYSWEECARELASAFNLAQRTSTDWSKRKHGSNIDYDAKGNISSDQETSIRDAIAVAEAGRSLSEWSTTCAALNILSDLGKVPTYALLGQAANQLSLIGAGIEKEYLDNSERESSLRFSGRFDVLWRYLAAATHIATNFKAFWDSIPDVAMEEILTDSFLRRELLSYSTKYSKEFHEQAGQLADEFFETLLEKASGDVGFEQRFARLESIHPGINRFAKFKKDSCYVDEKKKCAYILTQSTDQVDLFEGAHDLGGTVLALDTILASPLEHGVRHTIDVLQQHSGVLPAKSWRGDKLLHSALLSLGVHPDSILKFLENLAGDEEEAIRWAAIDLAFSPHIRKRLIKACKSNRLSMSPSQLKAKLGSIIDLAVKTDGFHPWMQREFLVRFHREHREPVISEVRERFTLNDFPVSRSIIGVGISECSSWTFRKLHPEVEIVRGKLRNFSKRILLVLPPVTFSMNSKDASKTSTPPLGLGLLGGSLLAGGHDVHLADCHREPDIASEVIEHATEFDWVGFNVVFTTLRSFYEMAVRIKERHNAPAIVVGGPAVNLRAFQNAAVDNKEKSSWDFEIIGQAELNFSKLVTDDNQLRSANLDGVIPNQLSELVLRAGYSHTITPLEIDISWNEPIQLDRRIFSTNRGVYEPQKTRAIGSDTVEAHIVMSKGCDWNCSFCTERKALSGGESRRTVASVSAELMDLTTSNEDIRIQFIDDNLLPQIASIPKAEKLRRTNAIVWSESFLDTLNEIATSKGRLFGWRGIFRIEDFLEYEATIPNFVELLKESGCKMLAFGIEHGNPSKRSKMKVSKDVSNDDITSLFSRLHERDIHTKAYFIIGGPKETPESVEETVAFAINCGASLAYFALYKEFVPATKALKNDQRRGSDEHKSYSSYDELIVNWDTLFLDSLVASKAEEAIQHLTLLVNSNYNIAPWKPTIQVYEELSRLGFKFADLVKYNDYHSENGPSSKVLNKLNFGDQGKYENAISAAYIRFYLRKEFVPVYRSLISKGY